MMGRNLFNSQLIMFGMLVIGLCGFVIDTRAESDRQAHILVARMRPDNQ